MAASQTATLRLLTALHLHRRDWRGALLLGIGLNDDGRALALASLAAGAAALLLENDASQVREANREGCCTFTVTTLEEGLRALKNEIRQGRAITVALSGNRERWLAEMVERGVLPQAIASASELSLLEAGAVSKLQEWGAERLSGLGLIPTADASDLTAVLDDAIGERWRIEEHIAETMRERQAEDAAMSEVLMGDPGVAEAARLWLRSVPSLFPRSLSRSLWVETGK